MDYNTAINILINIGWNYYGADVIVSALSESNMLKDLTKDKLYKISEDYADR